MNPSFPAKRLLQETLGGMALEHVPVLLPLGDELGRENQSQFPVDRQLDRELRQPYQLLLAPYYTSQYSAVQKSRSF